MKRFGLQLFFTALSLGLVFLFSAGCQTYISIVQYKGYALDPPVSLPDFELMAANGQLGFKPEDFKADLTHLVQKPS